MLSFIVLALVGLSTGLNFDEWAKQHGRQYPVRQEYIKRKLIWADNVRYIEQYNAQQTGVTLSVNHLADKSHEEYKSLQTMPELEALGSAEYESRDQPPANKDWRKEGAVTPVLQQGDCGSCYAFSAIGAVESMYAIKHKKLIAFSEQQIVDCSQPWGNNGCDGGTQENVYRYLMEKGAVSAESYPYKGKDESCTVDYNATVARVSGYTKIKKYSERDLMSAVGTVGPVSVSIDAGERSMQFYAGGIYADPMCITARIDHGVVAVGYGTEKAGDFWIIRNSWGPGWGLNGYMKLARNRQNMCGVASQAVFPTVD